MPKLNYDMPLDVFAKLCADECLRLRKTVGELNDAIDKNNKEIEKLKRQIKLKDDADFMAIKEVREQEMYKQIRKENKRLRDENIHLKREIGLLVAKKK